MISELIKSKLLIANLQNIQSIKFYIKHNNSCHSSSIQRRLKS